MTIWRKRHNHSHGIARRVGKHLRELLLEELDVPLLNRRQRPRAVPVISLTNRLDLSTQSSPDSEFKSRRIQPHLWISQRGRKRFRRGHERLALTLQLRFLRLNTSLSSNIKSGL